MTLRLQLLWISMEFANYYLTYFEGSERKPDME